MASSRPATCACFELVGQRGFGRAVPPQVPAIPVLDDRPFHHGRLRHDLRLGVGGFQEIVETAVGGGLLVHRLRPEFLHDAVDFGLGEGGGPDVAEGDVFPGPLQRLQGFLAGVAGGDAVEDHGGSLSTVDISGFPFAVRFLPVGVYRVVTYPPRACKGIEWHMVMPH